MAPTRVHTLVVSRPIDPRVLGDQPFWRFTGLFGSGEYCFLLDSALADGVLGRYSFLGGRPAAVLKAHRTGEPAGSGTAGQSARLTLERRKDAAGRRTPTPETHRWVGDAFAALRDLRAEYWLDRGDDPKTSPSQPFCGGLVGYFGYEAGHFVERLPDTGRDDLHLPDLAFLVIDEVLALDHRTGELTVTITGRGDTAGEALADANRRANRWPRRLSDFAATLERELPRAGAAAPVESPLSVRAHFGPDAYGAAVQRCREHILAGDAFEICLTNRLETRQPAPAWELYSRLRRINPAPFASYLQFPEFQIVGSSPERFLRLDADRVAESRPIKGTRPRGATEEEDRALRRELSLSPKDRAENLMIVDLVRSDLGRVAEIGSVTVPELLVVEQYATVFQLISTIRARLRDDCDALDLVRACFPGGSMTGAPKIEAMKIIDSIEPTKRGVYAGAIGYLDHAGAMDLSIVIRTIVCQAGRCTFGIGGAVVADSDPAAEYQETMDKAKALLEALRGSLAGK